MLIDLYFPNHRLCTLLLSLIIVFDRSILYNVNGFSINVKNRQYHNNHLLSFVRRTHHDFDIKENTVLYAEKVKQSRNTATLTTVDKKNIVVNNIEDDDETPAGIVGAQFFGGNKQKEEFYDPIAEMEAGLDLSQITDESYIYNRFMDRTAFPNEYIASIAESLQIQINQVLYSDETIQNPVSMYKYASSMIWNSIFQKSTTTTPLQEIENSLNFYRRFNVAIICGNILETKDSTTKCVQLRWEISVIWPTIWEPRILITGTSILTINDTTNQIIQQTDILDTDLYSTILRQYIPRFWDLYHIGMTPAAEISPFYSDNSKKKNIFASYTIKYIPSRLVLRPTIIDTNRDDNNASTLPNHAFTCIIKTMGPTKQSYIPVTGIQVRIQPITTTNTNNGNNENQLQIQWYVPIATEYTSNPILQLPGNDIEIPIEQQPTCQYLLMEQRTIASIPYGGNPQDIDVTKIRKLLYDQIINDGYQPKLDPISGRPIFFFIMNSIKACYTNEGLGMAVYEWRPKFTKPNEIAIELEI